MPYEYLPIDKVEYLFMERKTHPSERGWVVHNNFIQKETKVKGVDDDF